MKKVYEAPTTEMYALQTEGLIALSSVPAGDNEKVIDGWGAMSKKKSR